MEPLEQTLAQHPFLAGLDPRHVRRLAGLGSRRIFDPGQTVFHVRLSADECYLVCRGKVRTSGDLLWGDFIVTQTQVAGDVIGWSWLRPPSEGCGDYGYYTARALEPTELIALDGKALRRCCEEDHDLGYEVMKRFALVILQRVVETESHVERLPYYTEPREPSDQ
jgi:CRP-like cAMP-binding protein